MKQMLLIILVIFSSSVYSQAPPDIEPSNDYFFTAPEATFSVTATAYNLSPAGDKDIVKVVVPGTGGVIEVILAGTISFQPIIQIYKAATWQDTLCHFIIDANSSQCNALVPNGTYFVRISDNGNNTPGPYNLIIRLDTVGGGEFNNYFIDATDLNPDGSLVTDTLFQAKLYGIFSSGGSCFTPQTESVDRDYYKIIIPSPGAVLELEVEENTDIQPEIFVYKDTACNYIANGSNICNAVLPGGIYYFRISDELNNQTDEDPFSVYVNMDTTGGMEFNNYFLVANDLNSSTDNLDITFQSKIYGEYGLSGSCSNYTIKNDLDYYKVHVAASGGVIEVVVPNPPSGIQLNYFIYHGDVLADTLCSYIAKGENQCSAVVPGGIYYIKVIDELENQTTPTAFTTHISIDYEDSADFNNYFNRAADISLNDTLFGKIYGQYGHTGSCTGYTITNDLDYYKFTIEECGIFSTFIQNIPSGIQVQMRLFASDTTLAPITSVTGTNGSNQLERFLLPGTYYLLLNDQLNNQTSDNLYRIITKFKILPVAPAITIIGDLPLCPNANVTLSSSSATNNFWFPGNQTSQSIIVGAAGIYSVQLDSAGCINGSEEIVIDTVPDPIASFVSDEESNNLVVFNNSSLHATSYVWNFGDDSSTETGENISHTFANGSYTVSLIAINSCGVQDTFSTTVNVVSGVKFVDFTKYISVSPNPCSICEVRGNFNPGDLIITDVLGRKQPVTFVKTANGYSFHLEQFAQRGIYFITNTKTLQVIKFVKE